MAFLRIFGALLGALFSIAIFTFVFGMFGAFLGQQTGIEIGGGIGFLIGSGVGISMIRRAVTINWLRKNGTQILATVIQVQKKQEARTSSYTGANGQMQQRTTWITYYVVRAQGIDPQTRQMLTFESRLSRRPNGSVTVWFDPNDPRKYDMKA